MNLKYLNNSLSEKKIVYGEMDGKMHFAWLLR